ncbi:WGR domain protein, partial [Leptospira santarosai str. CBC523]|uniref:WGR domain-containing protein n=1 Tax=Leptospira santarosai TaxID=28183 RepID=UPI0002BEE99C
MKQELTYQDGSSNKFWNIEVSGNSFTVTYGKIGTSGQTQTKTFDNEDKCLKEAQKLLSEKLKKGYQGTGEVVASTSSPKSAKNKTETSEIKSAQTKQTTATNGKVAIARESQTHSQNGNHTIEEKKLKEPIEKTLGLSKEELSIRFNIAAILPKEKPQSFDLKTKIEQLSSLKSGIEWGSVDWTDQNIPLFMNKQEAHFWFLALTCMENLDGYEEQNKRVIQKLQDFLNSQTIDGNLALEKAMNLLERQEDSRKEKRITPPSYITIPFYTLFGLEKTIHFLATYNYPESVNTRDYSNGSYYEGFARLLPILGESERKLSKELIKPHLKPRELDSENTIAPILIALDLGMKEELLPVVESWGAKKPNTLTLYDNAKYRKNIIFLLEDSEVVKRNMRKIGYQLESVDELKRWLGITGYSDLEWAALSVKTVFRDYNNERHKEMLKLFLGIKAPEAARPMLHLYAIPKLASETKHWFIENPYFAIEGLVPAVLDGDKKISESAIDILQSLFARGYKDTIVRESQKHSEEIRETIKNEILENSTLLSEPFDDSNTPAWLSDAVKSVPKGKAISWVVPEELPPILVQKKKLSVPQIAAVLSELKEKGLGESSALLSGLKE